eukprot:TRINITY_DN6199_c0_g1_i1.p1 TRINITY_DN6199_c0_g1~~TRINITY_DN6199_c0_g1_i1.p1  ORF type:complete len:248 (-),score=37.03 TRINITY_DN6199_c0_g1_i1:62-805(-)
MNTTTRNLLLKARRFQSGARCFLSSKLVLRLLILVAAIGNRGLLTRDVKAFNLPRSLPKFLCEPSQKGGQSNRQTNNQIGRRAWSVEVAPPDSDTASDSKSKKDWVECLLEYEGRQGRDAAEMWVFRKRDRGEFERLLHLRINGGYPPGGESLERPVDFVKAGVTVSCKDRTVDDSIVCAECMRVLTGGAYGNGGISVAAYPPKAAILDCLDLSGIVAVEQGKREDGSALITKLTETAFCNSLNVAM